MSSSTQQTTNGHDRLRELQDFDNTKLGVKGLVDSGITRVPRIFQHPPDIQHDHDHNNDYGLIPVIDLLGPHTKLVEQLRAASAKFGFFQVINHGVPITLMDRLIEAVKAFHELPSEEKIRIYTRESIHSGVGFHSNYDLFHSKAASWRDTLQVRLGPIPVHPPDIPHICSQMEGLKPQLIVAMKGHPGTGKSTVAVAIAAALRCPLVDKDDIRDATLSLSSATSSSLNDLSYDAIWRVASTQLRVGLSVVVDSPLSRRNHLDSILKIAGGSHRVVIVECRPSDEAEWRRRLELRGEEDGGVGHKPHTWQDIERLLEGYDGCTEYDVGEVPRLIVDTTGASDGVLSNVMEFIHSHCPDQCDHQS